MASKKPEVPANAHTSPMTYEVRRRPNPRIERMLAAQQADSMTVDTLKATAERLQIDTGGATRQADLAQAVKLAAGVIPDTPTQE
jgi:hypothetical protein